jgi:ergothioneine biosynthesis protein EgtB
MDDAGAFRKRFEEVWARTDRLFEILAPGAMLARPIALRHPFIFYLGHLPAFAWIHVSRRVMERPAFDPRLDEIFERGIDPDADDPSRCHPHSVVPAEWPDVADVVAYRDRVRALVLDDLDLVGTRTGAGVMAERGRAVRMALEHELMHQETLLYMMQQVPYAGKRRPAAADAYRADNGLRPERVEVPGGVATLGASFERLDFGWDNEFGEVVVRVPSFSIDTTPVTNAQFLSFVEGGGYEARELWTDEDLAWRHRTGLAHPTCWSRSDRGWLHVGMFEHLPLTATRDWPVHVSLAEARAYARWRGARLPAEAEFHRAAYATPTGAERAYPWGDEAPTPAHANVDFVSWSPRPVGSHPAGASAWGVHELVGNGWEWTETPFAPFPGFTPYIPGYPGYSADFFDCKHYALKGGSWATDAQLLRRSFRNWFQARYPYVFAKFRCVYSEAARTSPRATPR